MKLAIVTVLFISLTTPAIAQKSCDYAGQSYSVGATICECPGVKAQDVDWTGDKSHITSRRLACSAEQIWEDTKTFCIDMTTSHTSRLYDKYMQHFCPSLPVNFAEIQKAVNQEIAKVLDKAPKSTLVTVVESICRRVKLDAQCKALLDAMGAL